jgi:hypothetical protein
MCAGHLEEIFPVRRLGLMTKLILREQASVRVNKNETPGMKV